MYWRVMFYPIIGRYAPPQKVPHFTQQASFVVLFSEGRTGSPVLTIPPGECNAITNRSFGESRVDFFV